MRSEELLLGIEGVDPETTLGEMVRMIDQATKQPTAVEWENLADVAFLALIHKKPKSFRKAVDRIARIFAGMSFHEQGESYQYEAGENAGRSLCLICSDAPTDPVLIAYMLGVLKGALRACRLKCGDFEASVRERIEARVQYWMQDWE